MRRLFYVALGATAGVLIVRKISKTAQAFSAGSIGDRLAGSAGGIGEAIREFAEQVVEAMNEREQVLRAELGLDGSHDVVDVHTVASR
ncbi:MAG: hypothetical protein M3Z02_06645 [Actinomycetota bacterium]|nr:hypothetical protein [Actinomycetota bacterium]